MQLGISLRTVGAHLTSIYTKLGVTHAPRLLPQPSLMAFFSKRVNVVGTEDPAYEPYIPTLGRYCTASAT
jgi:Bacterial regulatory proteins, luxR family